MDLFEALLASKIAGGSAPAPVLIDKSITANGEYQASADEADGYSAVTVDVPNTYGASDEGKVVQSGALVAQTATSASTNGTVDTTTNNSIVIDVPNSYGASDEGKVVSNGALVAQTSTSVSQNGVIDTTLNNSVTVQVPEGAEIGSIESRGGGVTITNIACCKVGDTISATCDTSINGWNATYYLTGFNITPGSTITASGAWSSDSGDSDNITPEAFTIDNGDIKITSVVYKAKHLFAHVVITPEQ
jgi:hypothetical protein